MRKRTGALGEDGEVDIKKERKSFEAWCRKMIVTVFKGIKRGRWKKAVKWILCVMLIMAGAFLFGRHLLSDELEVTFYHFYSPKIMGTDNTRIVVLSDLHNREFGTDNKDLIGQIAALQPDLIIMAGDMVNGGGEGHYQYNRGSDSGSSGRREWNSDRPWRRGRSGGGYAKVQQRW